MELFHIIDDVQVILHSRGVYRQVPVYRRGADLFAKHGAGFVKLMSSKGTTAPNVSWLDMDGHGSIHKTGGKFNSPYWWDGRGKKPV